MLQLKGIKKDYVAGNTTVHALKGIDITFRDNEFVSILGHSGCGKTTLLNIIGGLDHYTEGNLFIDNVSTQKFTDRDWDTYRNHRIGFVFQTYNLIPHQTILTNVELALTIGGVEKKERTRRAKEALDKVGLKDLYGKKPNQLSGGQCQRVAIARALVNEPEILLADEPTGALDSETSVQIMELIKEIAKDRLVIMVTHNPELAERYSTRIVRLSDGNIVSDSNPYGGEEEAHNKKQISKNSKLSFWSAFKLSAQNLWSKAKRTGLVCFAGSIGIIGIALVLAISSGITNYIYSMQDDMLAGNPISISESTLDLTSMMSSMSDMMLGSDEIKEATEDGYINTDLLVKYLVERGEQMENIMVSNDITREYVDYIKNMPSDYYAAVNYNYNIDMSNNLYTDFKFTGHEDVISLTAAKQIYASMLERTDFAKYSPYIATLSDSFRQAPDNADYILEQYEFLTGEGSKVATEADELMIVVSNERELSDLLLAQLGYYTQEQFFNIVYKATDDSRYKPEYDKERFSYEELLGKTFTWYPNDCVYERNTLTLTQSVNPFLYNMSASSSWQGKKLKLTGILVRKADQNYGCLSSGFYYTASFAEEVLKDSLDSEIVKYLVDNKQEAFTSLKSEGRNIGITFNYQYNFEGEESEVMTGFVGEMSRMSMFGGMLGGGSSSVPNYYTLSLRDLGGVDIPNEIRIYPTDFDHKDFVTAYLDEWGSDNDITVNGKVLKADDRSEIIYNDTLSIVIAMINQIIKIITYALIAFTALALVVSTVMIAIITYVSVIERIKEIGVIRSLGGRKRDVSALFIAETLIIGGISGAIGIAITYLLSGMLNLILGSLIGIYTLASLPISSALIMIVVSIVLTLISGVVPARLAAKKDPAVALRSE